jgi:hypothetical protein
MQTSFGFELKPEAFSQMHNEKTGAGKGFVQQG